MSSYHDDLPRHSVGQIAGDTTKWLLVSLLLFGGFFLLICGGIVAGALLSFTAVQHETKQATASRPFRAVPYATPEFAPTEYAAESQYAEQLRRGQFGEALALLEQVLATQPSNATWHNNKAWLLCTCPMAQFRDGEQAIEHANTACRLTNWQNHMFVDTLAAAYAEAGEYELAVKWQNEAIALMPASQNDPGFAARLDLYEAGKPYREGVLPGSLEQTTQPGVEPSSIDISQDLQLPPDDAVPAVVLPEE